MQCIDKIWILQARWAFVCETFTLHQNLASNSHSLDMTTITGAIFMREWLWTTQNYLIKLFCSQFVFDVKTVLNITIAHLKTFTSTLIKVSSGFYRSGQWGSCLEPPLRMASSATTFAKPRLNYLHGTPQSLDQAVLAVIVLLQHREIKEKGRRKAQNWIQE